MLEGLICLGTLAVISVFYPPQFNTKPTPEKEVADAEGNDGKDSHCHVHPAD